MTQVPNGFIGGQADFTPFIPEMWSTEIYRYRLETLIWPRFIKSIAFKGKSGDVIKLPKVYRLGVNDKLPKTPVTYQTMPSGQWSMTVDKYKEASIMIEDLAELQANFALRSIYTEELGTALATDFNRFCQGMRAAIYAAYSSDQITDESNPISTTMIQAAQEILDRRLVPRQGRKLIVSPAHLSSLIADSKLSNRDFSSLNSTWVTGQVAEALGLPIIVDNSIGANSLTGLKNGDNDPNPGPTPGVAGSRYLPTQDSLAGGTLPLGSGGATGKLHTATIIGPDCIVGAWQKKPNPTSEWDIDYQAYKVVSTQIYGAKLWRETDGITITTRED